MTTPSVKKYRGSKVFRQRIVFSVLTSTPVRITDIRPLAEDPGLSDYEVNFLKLVATLTNGTTLQINETGTKVNFRPGFVVGGKRQSHKCVPSRGIGYYVEAILPLLLFAKNDTTITFTNCVTNHDLDLTVDTLRSTVFPLLKHFGVEDSLSLVVKKRGLAPLGGGEVVLTIPRVRKLAPIDLLDVGKIKRIRGLAYTTRMAPNTANRVGVSARAILNGFIPDVWIFTDHYKGKQAGKSPGYGLSLVAESTTGSFLAVEQCAPKGMTPEEFGDSVSRCLCEELSFAGFVDTCSQSLALQLMVLTPEDVSRIRLGRLSEYTMDVLRTIRDFFGVTFQLKEDDNSVVCTCLGVGHQNFNRQVD